MCLLGQSVVKLGCGVAVKEWIERYLAPAQEMLGVVIHWVSLGIVTFQDFVCSRLVKCLRSGLGSPWLNQAVGLCCWLLCRSKAFHGQVRAPWDCLELGRLVQRTEGEPLNLESGAEQSCLCVTWEFTSTLWALVSSSVKWRCYLDYKAAGRVKREGSLPGNTAEPCC